MSGNASDSDSASLVPHAKRPAEEQISPASEKKAKSTSDVQQDVQELLRLFVKWVLERKPVSYKLYNRPWVFGVKVKSLEIAAEFVNSRELTNPERVAKLTPVQRAKLSEQLRAIFRKTAASYTGRNYTRLCRFLAMHDDLVGIVGVKTALKLTDQDERAISKTLCFPVSITIPHNRQEAILRPGGELWGWDYHTTLMAYPIEVSPTAMRNWFTPVDTAWRLLQSDHGSKDGSDAEILATLLKIRDRVCKLAVSRGIKVDLEQTQQQTTTSVFIESENRILVVHFSYLTGQTDIEKRVLEIAHLAHELGHALDHMLKHKREAKRTLKEEEKKGDGKKGGKKGGGKKEGGKKKGGGKKGGGKKPGPTDEQKAMLKTHEKAIEEVVAESVSLWIVRRLNLGIHCAVMEEQGRAYVLDWLRDVTDNEGIMRSTATEIENRVSLILENIMPDFKDE